MIAKIVKYTVNLLNLPEVIFIIIAIIFGSLFLFITPSGCVPDEPAHMFRSADVACGSFSSKERPVEKPYDALLTKVLSDRFKIDEPIFAMRYSPVMYLSSALGLKIGAVIFEKPLSVFYLGRFFNLLLYIVLIAFAIRLTPVFKYPFMYIGLLPMSLFLGMSYSADSFGISFSLLMFAYLFKLIFNNTEPNNKQLTLLGILSFIGAIAKGLIYPMFLYFFLPIKKYKYQILLLIFSVTVLGFLYSSMYLNIVNTNPTCEVINDKSYIFNYPADVINSILITTKEKLYIYIHQMIGYLGWLSIPLPASVCNRVIFIFILMMFVLKEEVKLNIKIYSCILFILFYILILYMEFVTWTPVGKMIIEGVQGRYFIPFLPLLFLAFPSYRLNVGEKYKNWFKILVIICIVNALYMSVLGLNLYYYELNIKGFM